MPVDTVVTDVRPGGWSDAAALEYENADTLSLRDMTLMVRHDDRIAGDSVTLRISVYTPDSLLLKESLRLDVPRSHKAAALAGEIDAPYRQKVRLGKQGVYRIEITPARTVKGISAVGMTITKSD